MKCYEDNRTRAWVLNRMRERLAKEPRSGPFHASELFQCWRKTILLRETPKVLTEQDILYFIRGYAIQEYIFGAEEDGVEAMGVVMSPDFVEGDHVFEMKTTNFWYETKSKGVFDPTTMSDWITRTRAYVAALGKKKAHIAVYFMAQSDLHVWTLEFTDEELELARVTMAGMRDTLQDFVDDRLLPPVTTRAYEKECGYCPFHERCLPELRKEGMDA